MALDAQLDPDTDIARELFLSLKNVESRTRNVYAKRGVTSRVELVARLGQRDGEALAPRAD